MSYQRMHHIGLASSDYDGTVDFYTRVIGWPIVWQDRHVDRDSGQEIVRHVFFDAGDGLFVAFLCSVPGSPVFPKTWATDINSGLGLPTGIYHFAFGVPSMEALETRRQELIVRGADVSGVLDHGWCKSIYLRDAVNDLMLEFCVQTREFNDDDKLLKSRQAPTFEITDRQDLEDSARIMGVPVEVLQVNGELKN